MAANLSVIVLSVQKYSDSSSLVHAYSRERGRLLLWLNRSKSRKGGLRQSLFHPLSMLEIVANERKDGAQLSVKEARIRYALRTVPSDPVKLSIALFLSEFLSQVLKEESPDQNLFDFISNSVMWLDETERNVANFHLAFLMHISRFLGLYPNVEDYRKGNVFDMDQACFLAVHPLHGQVLERDEAETVARLMRMTYMNMHLFRFSRAERQRVIDVLMQYYSIHVAGFRQMRSLEVMREIFSD